MFCRNEKLVKVLLNVATLGFTDLNVCVDGDRLILEVSCELPGRREHSHVQCGDVNSGDDHTACAHAIVQVHAQHYSVCHHHLGCAVADRLARRVAHLED